MNNKLLVTWQKVFDALAPIDRAGNIVYGVPNGGMIAAGFLSKAINTSDIREANIILDDLLDSGHTRDSYLSKYPSKSFHVLIDKKRESLQEYWLEFPWERDHPKHEMGVEENITRIFQFIGENAEREGLLETPKRVIKSWSHIYSGYSANVADVFKVFDSDGYDEMVILKNIEMYSMCEHHMLPFHGKAHIAYLVNKKVIGISKLARLLNIFSRRLQIQERICKQVTEALDQYLEPLGSACVIEAKHMCMCMRGVEKQNSIMTTSSLTGRFRDSTVRAELMNLISMP